MNPAAARRAFFLRRVAASGLIAVTATVLLVASVLAATAPEASAQERTRRWFSLRDLFAPRHERVAPRRVERPAADTPKTRKTRQPKRKKAPAAPSEPDVVVQEKAPDARVVLVVGDFLGSALADGLVKAYAENPNVAVVDRTRGSSGFVRDDVFDWPAEVKAIVEKEKPTAVVVMLGSNDRQQMRIDGERHPAGSEPWTKEYQKRVGALATALAETKIPFAWMGLPAFKFSKMSDDILVFNEFYRAAAVTAGAQFIDIWDGFVDEKGVFTSTGPDITGQPVRLRTSDGINFTAAGKRKLAFYAEKPLAKILGLAEDGSTMAGLPLPEAGLDPNLPMPLDRTLPISLSDPALDGGTELLGGGSRMDRATPASDVTALGRPGSTSTPGRADALLWPTRTAAPSAPDLVKEEQTVTAPSSAAVRSIP